MTKEKLVSSEQVEEEVFEEVQAQDPSEVISGEIHIRIMQDGGIQLYVPETSKELKPEEIESVTYMVYSKMHDARVVQQAMEAFKQRLG